MGLGGAVPARAGAEVEQLVLDTVDGAVAAGLAHRWATALWRVSDDRVHRWRARRAERGGSLEDRRRAGAAVHALLAQEVDAILEIAEQWGPTDRSHRKLAHRGSYENSVWVSPSTFRRVLDANGLIVAQAPPRRREPRRPWLAWLVWEPDRIWIWDVTHFGRARRCVFAIVDMVSRRWISTVVSSEESSTQVRVVFDEALAVEGLIDLLTDERLDLPLDDPRRPILLAVIGAAAAATLKCYMRVRGRRLLPRRRAASLRVSETMLHRRQLVAAGGVGEGVCRRWPRPQRRAPLYAGLGGQEPSDERFDSPQPHRDRGRARRAVGWR